MAMDRIRFEAEQEQKYGRSQPVVVRVGGKEWIVGGHAGSPPRNAESRLRTADRWDTPTSYSKTTPKPPVSAPQSLQPWRTSRNTPRLSKQVLRPVWQWVQSLFRRGEYTLNHLAEPRPSGQATRFRRTPARRGRAGKMANSFRTGIGFGMAMGCLSLILFHAMQPELSVPQPERGPAPPVPTVAQPTVAQMTGTPVQIPAVHLSVIRIGSFKDFASASHALEVYRKRGIRATIFHQSKYTLVPTAAVRATDLHSFETQLSRQGLATEIVNLSVPTTSVRTSSQTTAENAEKVSSWLAAAVSAGNALIASVADGAPERDANQAFRTAEKQLPTAATLAATGYGHALKQAEAHLTGAFTALHKADKSTAMGEVLEFYSVLIAFSHA